MSEEILHGFTCKFVHKGDTCKLVDVLVDENRKLREYITRLEQANIMLDSDNCDLRNDMKDMQFFIAENRKLRELVVDMLPFAEVGMDDTCVTRRCCLFEQCEDVVGVRCTIEQHMLDRMRELGIEVK